MRNPLTNRERKKTRHSTTRKRRSTYCLIPNERVLSSMIFKTIFLTINVCTMYAILAIWSYINRNNTLLPSFVNRFFVCLGIVDLLASLESSIMDVFHDVGYQTFRKDAIHMRIDQFINDDHCENITRFKKYELLDLIDRLELNEQVYVHHHNGNFYNFYHEELDL